MSSTDIQDEPGLAFAEDGLVLLDGPAGVTLTLTPDAAERTGRSLIEAALAARAFNAGAGKA